MDERDMNRCINVNITKLCDTNERNEDYILPDYIADIKKLVQCDSEAVLHNVFNNGNNLLCEGEIVYNVLCICEDDSLQSIIYSDTFTLNIPVKDDNVESVSYFCKTENPNARLVNPRRISFRARLNIFMQKNESVDTEPEISCNEDICLQKKTEKIRSMMISSECEANLHASHDIEISSALPEVSAIVYCKVNTVVNEIKKTDTQASIRGESYINILYLGNDSNYHKISETVGFNEYIANEYTDDDACICEVRIKDIKVSVQNNSFGEMRIIELDYGYDLCHKHYYGVRCEAVCDAYSTKKEFCFSKEEIEYIRPYEAFSSPLSVNEIMELSVEGDIIPKHAVEVNANVDSHELFYDAERNKFVLHGEIEWTLLCICEGEERYTVIKQTAPFKYEREGCGYKFDLFEEHKCDIIKCNAEINGSKTSLNAELYINAVLGAKEKHCRAVNCTVSEKENNRSSVMTLYYPVKGETLWEVAKRYKCRCEDIIEVNSLQNEDLAAVKVLLIP
ncbi:MAG: DUF3794 domain-containing protein [Ruminococcaceae bacterium]|nr:DUF3794 domain-containing protein [Oscillospiraceae bacterium]